MWKRILTAVLAIVILVLTMGQVKRYGRTERYYAEEVRPMAVDYTWVTTTGDMNSAASYSPAAVPGATDTLAFVGSALGGSDMSATVNVDALDEVALAFVHTRPSYPGNIGLPGTPAEIGTQGATRFVHQGTGTVHLNQSVLMFVCDSPNLVSACEFSVGAAMLFVVARQGRTTVHSGTAVVGLHVSPYDGREPFVEFKGTSGDIGAVFQSGGTVICPRDQDAPGSNIMSGGTWVQTRDSVDGLNWIYMSGGVLEYNSLGSFSAWMLGGTIDLTQDHRAKTMLNLAQGPGAEVLENDNLSVTTYYGLDKPIPTYGW